MKGLLKPVLGKIGVWGIAARMHRFPGWLRRLSYSVAGALRLGFAVQLWVLPRTHVPNPVFVRPSVISYAITKPHLPEFRIVCDGLWDLEKEPLSPGNCGIPAGFRTMQEIFVENKTADATSQYKEMAAELLTAGKTSEHQYRTIDQVLSYLNGFQQVYDNIKANGYKTQEELGNPSFEDEIGVCIGRDGEVIWRGHGLHRLAIARILDLERVPVNVWNVHRLWAERCFMKYGGGLLEAVYKGLDDID